MPFTYVNIMKAKAVGVDFKHIFIFWPLCLRANSNLYPLWRQTRQTRSASEASPASAGRSSGWYRRRLKTL